VTETHSFVVKKALSRLRVSRDWNVPLSRNASEVGWLMEAGRILPEAVPKILAHDAAVGAFAMEYFNPVDHPVWKADLREG
jgi:5-methylthioribose kinase